jgi:hypothetical protein
VGREGHLSEIVIDQDVDTQVGITAPVLS